MSFVARPTSMARLSRRQARIVLALAAAVTALFVYAAFQAPPLDPSRSGPGDVALYQAEIERIRAGEGYYQAAATELRPRDYPTRSLMNWRTPLPMWLIGVLPYPLGKLLLIVAAGGAILLAFRVAERETGTLAAFGCVILLIGALLPCVMGDLYVMPTVWAGVFIALSAVAYADDRPAVGVLAGLVALFLRELAGLYCVVALAIALRERNRREAIAWCSGLAVYATFFALHALTVQGLIRPDDIAHDHGWLRLGGATFLVGVTRMNCYLLVLPLWVSAIYLAAVVLGIAGWGTTAGTRIGLSLAAYLITFSIVGQPFNLYWGSLLAPLMCLAAARSSGTFRDLLAAAGLTSASTTTLAKSS